MASYDRGFYYSGGPQQEAEARLLHIVENRLGSGIVTGCPGSGKSLLLQRTIRGIHQGRHVVSIDLVRADTKQLLWKMAAALQLGPLHSDSELVLWTSIAECLLGRCLSSLHTVVVFDHLERADRGSLWLVEKIAGLHHVRPTWLTVLGASRRSDLPIVGTMCDLRVELSGIHREEVTDWIEGYLQSIGCGDRRVTGDACDVLFAHSAGIPGRLNRLIELSALAAASDGRMDVTAEIVRGVVAEFSPAVA